MIIEQYNCDYNNPNELVSLELALQLQSEELQNIKVQNNDNEEVKGANNGENSIEVM